MVITMILITIDKDLMQNINRIEVTGHANSAEYGKDIICASVSVILQTVGYMLEEREDALTSVKFAPGDSLVEIGNPTRESHLITSVFEYGAKQLSEQFPDYVNLKVS